MPLCMAISFVNPTTGQSDYRFDKFHKFFSVVLNISSYVAILGKTI